MCYTVLCLGKEESGQKRKMLKQERAEQREKQCHNQTEFYGEQS